MINTVNESTPLETKTAVGTLSASGYQTGNGNQVVAGSRNGTTKEKWLSENFPLLTAHGFRAALAERLHKAVAANPNDHLQYEEIRWAVIIQARIQMEQLAVKALKINVGSEYARAVIGDFLLAETAGQPVELIIYGQERAALTILELAPRVLPKSLLACLIIGLTHIIDMPETARGILLEALQVLIGKWRKYGYPSDISSPHQIVLEALELELRRPAALQSEAFLLSICEYISKHPHAVFVPLLLTYAAEHASPAVQKVVTEVLRTINESLEMRWLNTRTDDISDTSSRAARLKTLGNSSSDTSMCIQTIFNNTKGVPIESLADPRAVELKKLMKNQSMSIKMAVCWSLYGQGKYCPELDHFTGGIMALSSVAMNSLSPGLTRDALELLVRLQEDFPESKARLDKANEKASKKFVERQIEPENLPEPKSFVIRTRSDESK